VRFLRRSRPDNRSEAVPCTAGKRAEDDPVSLATGIGVLVRQDRPDLELLEVDRRVRAGRTGEADGETRREQDGHERAALPAPSSQRARFRLPHEWTLRQRRRKEIRP
jgi:hypothetical protein